MEQPHESLVDEFPQDRRILQAKVPVDSSYKVTLAELLVRRKVCCWVAQRDVLQVGGCRVLNGLFGVGKGKYLEDGREIQRVIMNLIPSITQS